MTSPRLNLDFTLINSHPRHRTHAPDCSLNIQAAVGTPWAWQETQKRKKKKKKQKEKCSTESVETLFYFDLCCRFVPPRSLTRNGEEQIGAHSTIPSHHVHDNFPPSRPETRPEPRPRYRRCVLVSLCCISCTA